MNVMREILYAILVTDDGELTYRDVIHECKKDRWAPVLSYTTPSKSVATVVCCTTMEIAYQFANRNFGKKGFKGIILLSNIEINWIREQGWEIEKLTFPRLLVTRSDMTMGFQILEFGNMPNVFS